MTAQAHTVTDAHKMALIQMCDAFIDAVRAAGSLGAPGGVLYAAVMDKLSLSQFEAFMSALVATGKLRKSGELYFAN